MRSLVFLLRWFSSILLHSSLFLLIGAASFYVVASDRQDLKGLIASTGVYKEIVPSIIEENLDRATMDASGVPLDDPAVVRIVNEAFTPKFFQTASESVIDGFYDWLEQDSDSLAFRIDARKQKAQLFDQLSTYAALRLDGLRPCSSEELQTSNVFTLACEPPGFYQQIVKEQVLGDLQRSSFLQNPVFTEDDLPRTSNDVPFSKQYDFLPAIFYLAKYAIVLSLLAIFVCSLFYLWVRRPLRKAFRSYGRDIFATGVTVLGFTVFYTYILPRFTANFQLGNGSSLFTEVSNVFMQKVNVIIINTALQIAVFGVLILLIERLSRPAHIYGDIAKKSGLASSLSSSKNKKKEVLPNVPVQTSEVYRTKKTRKRTNKYRKMGL